MKRWGIGLACLLAVSTAAFMLRADGARDIPQAEGAAGPVTIPPPALGYNLREGRALFNHYCVTCHGEEGRGDGLNAYNLDPKPRDLTDPAFQRDRTDDDLESIIRSGGALGGLSPGMPPWGRTLNTRQIHNLVDYIRFLGSSHPRDADS
ncbi:MAG: c-type cytochrome [Acidobacteriota bacterium]